MDLVGCEDGSQMDLAQNSHEMGFSSNSNGPLGSVTTD
jgi:hypothetical protein